MKYQFVKLFSINEYQVLIKKGYNHEDGYHITQSTHTDGCDPSVTLSFEDKAGRDSAFEEYNQERAQEFLGHMLEILS